MVYPFVWSDIQGTFIGGSGTVTNVGTSGSVTGGPIFVAGTISLVNDNATPGNSYYYGTDGTGTKGFFTLPTGTAPIYPLNEIPYGDGITAGGITDSNFTKDISTQTYRMATTVVSGASTDSSFTTNNISISGVTATDLVNSGFSLSQIDTGAHSVGMSISDPNLTPTRSGILATLDGTSLVTTLRLTNGLSTTSTWFWPTADGTAGQFLTTDGSGNLSFSTGAGTATLTQHQIGFGDASNLMTSNANFTYNLTTDRFSFASAIDTSNGIFYNGTGAPNGLLAHKGLGMDFYNGAELYTLGNTNTNQNNLTIDNVGKLITLTNEDGTGVLFRGKLEFTGTTSTLSYEDLSGSGISTALGATSLAASMVYADTTYNSTVSAYQGVIDGSATDGTAFNSSFTFNSTNVEHKWHNPATGYASSLTLDSAKGEIRVTDGTTFDSYFTGNATNSLVQFADITNSIVTSTFNTATASYLELANSVSGATTVAKVEDQVVTLGTTAGGNGTTAVLDDVNQNIALYKSQVRTVDVVAYNTTNTIGLGYFHVAHSGSTGAVTDTLDTANFPVGTILVISDVDGIASTSNITIDADTGNTINGAGGSAQTLILNVDFSSVTIQLVNATTWMVI